MDLNLGIATETLESIFKIFFIISSGLYLIFAIVMVRQVQIMKNTLITDFSPKIKVLALVHLAAAVLLVLFYLGL
jgi:hypothetical protein